MPGITKTRLGDVLSHKECADLHVSFLQDVFSVLDTLRSDAHLYVFYTPADSFHLLEKHLPSYAKTFPQTGDTLGEKICNAFSKLFAENYSKVVLFGSDIPGIQAADISLAFDLLDRSDVVLGPTMDGGYYLVGLNEVNAEIFNSSKLSWGNKSVFDRTISIIESEKLNCSLVKSQLDIDTKNDLLLFHNLYSSTKNDGITPPRNTMKFINKIIGRIKE